MRKSLVTAIAVLACGCVSYARADLGSAFKAYDAKEFESAYAQFRELAELGSPLAQVNTGMMLLNGEGVKTDAVAAYGWILAASDNESGMAKQLVTELQGKFNAEQTAAAQRLVQSYGREGTRSRLFPALAEPGLDPATLRRAEAEGVQRLTFPARATEQGTLGFVEVAAILGADGRIHDAWITASLPAGVFDSSLLEAMREWHFQPAAAAEKPIPVAYVYGTRFGYSGEDGSDRPRVQRFVRERRAEAIASKKPPAQYLLARLLMLFPDLRVEEDETRKLLSEAAQKGHPPSQQFLGLCILRRAEACASRPPAEGVDLLARAAQSGEHSSQLVMAMLLLAEGGADASMKAARWLEAGARAGNLHSTKYLASILAASPVADVRNASRARQLIEPLTRPGKLADDPDAWQIRAAALAGDGSFDGAIESQARAVGLAKRWGWNAAPLEERLATYRGKVPWYGDLLELSGLQWGQEPSSGISETCGEVAAVGSRLARCNRKDQAKPR